MFGKKEDKPLTAGEAIHKLRETEEMLQKKQDFLEKKIEAETAIARKHAKTNKRLALQALKRKKNHEKKLQQIDGTLTTLEYQRDALDSATSNAAVFKTMGEAAKALKKAHSDMDVDEVHDIMDDIAEQHEIANEIAEAISNPVAFGGAIDEDDLEAELAELEGELELEEQEELDKELLKVGPTPELPEVPAAEPAKPEAAKKVTPKKKDDDDEMAELAAWAS